MKVTLDAPEELLDQVVIASLRSSYDTAKAEIKDLKREREELAGAFPSHKAEDLKDTKKYVKALRTVLYYYSGEMVE